MANLGDTVWTVSVDIQTEEDWDRFVGLEDWFIEDAPIEDIKQHMLSNPGWMHFMDVDYINMFQFSDVWRKLRDSGLAVAIKKCVVSVEGYVSPNDVYTKKRFGG